MMWDKEGTVNTVCNPSVATRTWGAVTSETVAAAAVL